jgi:ribonuclease HI
MPETSSEISIYADGACQANPGPGGYAAVILSGGQRRELSGGFRKTTNNRMELFAVIAALRELGEPNGKVTIYSDSQYVVNMINGGHAPRWRRNGWTRGKAKEPALNPDLWGDLLDLCFQHDVQFIWVRGHSDNRENARCDELAVAARQAADLPEDAGYEAAAAPVEPQQLSLFDSL